MPRSSSKSGRVYDRGRSERSDSVLDDPEVDRDVARGFGARTGLWVPLVARSETIGLIAVHDKLGSDARFNDNDLRIRRGLRLARCRRGRSLAADRARRATTHRRCAGARATATRT